MPDTKIKREPQGWIDVDKPNTFYRVRREARAARRADRIAASHNMTARKWISTTTPLKVVGLTAKKTKAVTIIDSGDSDKLTSLQERLLERLTKTQGVAEDDALEIIKNNGYNKAASYGHMRAAGATHSEAKIVIALSEPTVSLAYGKNRAQGYTHTDALREALQDGNNNISSAYSN